MSGHRRFGGALAPILFQSLHPMTFFVGAAAMALAVGCTLLSVWIEVPQLAPILVQGAVSLFVVRIALNSAFGEEMGGFFESSGSTWSESLAGVGRLFTLNLIWSIPLGLGLKGMISMMGPTAMPGGPVMLLLAAAFVLPPLFLIVAVGAGSFSTLFSTETWGSIFRGRVDEVAALFALYVGGLAGAGLLATFVALGAGFGNAKLILFLGLVGAAWTVGVTVTLLGRLVGGFLRSSGDAGGEDVVRRFDPDPFGAPIETRPGPRRATTTGTVRPETPVDDAAPASSADAATPGGLELILGEDAPVAFEEEPLGVASLGPEAGVEEGLVGVQANPDNERIQKLVDGDSLVSRLKANSYIEEDDLFLGLEDTEHILGQFGPHPQVLCRMAIQQHKLERPDATETMQRAVEAAMKINNVGVLADLQEAFPDEMNAVGLADGIRLRMAESLAMRDHHQPALTLYAQVLASAEKKLPVVKAMIKWAEELVRTDSGCEQALLVYDTVEQTWPEHPFAEFLERGRDDVQRRLVRATR